jgi:leucine dehydrogenase
VASFEELLDGWDGEQVVIHRDHDSGAWMFICVHSTRRGPAGGGTRMKTYDSPADALRDGMRLSQAMTSKLAVADLPFGGGKGVIAVPALPDGDARKDLFHRYGELVDSLHGTYVTSSDMNTGPTDMDVISERTEFVFGRSPDHGGSGNPAPPTARGVYHGIRASLAHVFGSDDPEGRTVLVQGAGSVGSVLSDLLAADGANLLVADVATERAQEIADRVGGSVVAADDVYDTECDVYSPCAVGATLNADTIPRLRCKIVAGSANNQLAENDDAERIHERGILYAPDFVINAGGVIGIVGLEQLGWDSDRLAEGLSTIGDTLREIYERAEKDGISTGRAADAIVDARLAAA